MSTEDDPAALTAMLVATPSRRNVRRSTTASKLLWSRVSELEELQEKLEKLQSLLVDLFELHEDISNRVSEDMHEAVQTATTGIELRQMVKAPFSKVLSAAITNNQV
ncbi:hypothetical protein DVH05_018773 [Phytophthora capsici]|nr:hypothetical protein DVH05_004525 [Phytophthora capsici]KAG1696227.1 hypothetical protein DVH05_018773 [Phytophthora capsici]|eukprot:jgi/Phyca11/98578/e_gw1.3.1285.1